MSVCNDLTTLLGFMGRLHTFLQFDRGSGLEFRERASRCGKRCLSSLKVEVARVEPGNDRGQAVVTSLWRSADFIAAVDEAIVPRDAGPDSARQVSLGHAL